MYLNIPAIQAWQEMNNQKVMTVQEAWDQITLSLEVFTASIADGSRKHAPSRSYELTTDDRQTLIAKFQF